MTRMQSADFQKSPASCRESSKMDATVRVHLWLEREGGMLFGMGRVLLLRKVEECGSLKKAAESLGMSYRAAWGKLKHSEEALGCKLVEKQGSNRDGYRLTDEGRRIMEGYEAWFKSVENHALVAARELLPWKVEAFGESPDRKNEDSVGGGQGGRSGEA